MTDARFDAETIEVVKHEGVTVTFADGEVARFDAVGLRRACPCATCRTLRARGEEAWPRPGAPIPLHIDDAELHGAWGLALTWNDGHTTGIYPWESLRRWHDGGSPFGPDSGLPGGDG